MVVNKPKGKAVYVIALSICLLSVLVFFLLSAWSLTPFGKRYLPDYYFNQLHGHHKSYVSDGSRLVLLNGVPADSLREMQRVEVTGNSLKFFGQLG